MKPILVMLFVALSAVAFAQTSSKDRDSVAQTSPFQIKVKMASIKAANNILSDPSQATVVRKYGQLIISEPNGGWLSAMSYGCMTNAAINSNSSDSDIEFTVNSLFAKYSYAYYKEQQP